MPVGKQPSAGAHSGPSIELRGVNYAFDKGESRKQVLFDINLTMHPGEVILLTGPSGSGKTTLLTLIGALRNPQEGSLKVFGQELNGLNATRQEKLRANIGFIFQDHNLLTALTTYENVKLATELHHYPKGEAEQQTKELLSKMGLEDRLHYKPDKLSCGQRQRVAICRALINRPRMILADEPTAALDKDTGRQVVDIICDFAKSAGCTVMMVTHDIRILDAADRILTMVDGVVTSNLDVRESPEVMQLHRQRPVY